MNKCIALSTIALVCMVVMTTAYGPMTSGGYSGYGGYYSYMPMYYGGGGVGMSGGAGGLGGGMFSIIFLIIIISLLGNGSLFGQGGKGDYRRDY